MGVLQDYKYALMQFPIHFRLCPRELLFLSVIQTSPNYLLLGWVGCKSLCQGKHNPHFAILGQKFPPLSYLLNPLVSIPYPKANNLQTIRSLSAPFQMGKMKREHIAILCLFNFKPRLASRVWSLAASMEAKQAAPKLHLDKHNGNKSRT